MIQVIARALRMQCISCKREGANPKTGLCSRCSF